MANLYTPFYLVSGYVVSHLYERGLKILPVTAEAAELLLMLAAAKREADWWLNMAAAAACDANRVDGPPAATAAAAVWLAVAAVRSEFRIWRDRVISAALLWGLMFCKIHRWSEDRMSLRKSEGVGWAT